MKDYIQVFTTTESKEEAEKIARGVVGKRLAACTQIIGPIKSIYRWKEKIEEEEEWLCIMKSLNDLYEQLEKVIKEIHSYEVPEILALPVVAGNQAYLEWLNKEVGDKTSAK